MKRGPASGCFSTEHASSCSELADEVKSCSDGELHTASLLDEDVRQILDNLRPDWTDQPYLLAVTSDGAEVVAGHRMRLELARRLGPRRAARIAAHAFRADRERKELELDRRRFLTRAAASLAITPFAPGAIQQLVGHQKSHKNNCELVGPLRTGDPVRTSLEADPEVVFAQELFGDGLWDRALHYRAHAKGHVFDVYTLDLPGSELIGGAARLFVIPVAGGAPDKVISRFVGPPQGGVAIELWSATGQLLGRATHRNGQTRTDAAPETPLLQSMWTVGLPRSRGLRTGRNTATAEAHRQPRPRSPQSQRVRWGQRRDASSIASAR